MSSTRRRLPFIAVSFGLVLVFVSGCVYFNTFYNARKSFSEAEKARKKSTSQRVTLGQEKYRQAIEKALKVVENNPKSGWYDDALYVLGVSYYYTQQYPKAERRLREILANYPKSHYVREATLYLAKAKLRQGDMEEARGMFEEIFQGDYSREFKTEAAQALGEYYFEDKQYDQARPYLLAVRDSLGNGVQKKLAQAYIADGYFEQFRFSDALGAYLQILGMEPDKTEKYHALYHAALCSYRLQRIGAGMDYLRTLMNDQVYFDSLGVLRLALAEGYEADDDLLKAEAIYEQIIAEDTRKVNVARANYYMGLMYQFDYDDLLGAKKYYEEASKAAGRSTEFGQDALQRSSDIGKLSTFGRKIKIDSTTTQKAVDQAAETQYNLAELYWFSLNKPDSAVLEMRYIVDSFPTSSLVPKAMIALAQMRRDQFADTVGADSVLRQMLRDHPRSDYAPEGMELLGLTGSAADTGYAEVYIRRAEKALADDHDYKTARQEYQYLVDSFPDSKYYLRARFSLVWLTEMYESPGDSSVMKAYRVLADSFPGTEWANEAARRGGGSTAPQPKSKGKKEEEREKVEEPAKDTTEVPVTQTTDTSDTSFNRQYNDPQQTAYIGANGDTLTLLNILPVQTEEEFEFPTQAYGGQKEDYYLYFQILLDFSGKVVDLALKVRSNNEEVNTRATRTVQSMTFDPLEISNRVVQNNLKADPSGGHWFVYKYLIQVPDFLK